MPSDSTSTTGTILVALQFGLIALLAWDAAAASYAARVPWVAVALLVAGIALAGWAVACNRPGNFNIRPVPREGGRLVQEGPYRLIRHPMYTAVLLCGTAAALANGGTRAGLALAALALVLVAKATIEERGMLIAHPAYAEYRARTRRFLPWIF